MAIALLLVTVGLHHLVVLAEERFMAERFGRTRDEYAARVPRYGNPFHGLKGG